MISSQYERRMMSKATTGMLLALCICFCGCGTSPSPDEQLKAIVDAKQIQMNKWLADNKPDLARAVEAAFIRPGIEVKSEITDETDADSRIRHPYVGTIKIGFPTGVNKDGGVFYCTITATYL